MLSKKSLKYYYLSSGLLLLLLSYLAACKSIELLPHEDIFYNIGLGSCSDQDKPQPILNTIADKQPNVFIYLGDNIYGDTRDMDELAKKYAKLAQKSAFQRLKASTKLLATWDDHDYGENDAGRSYPHKAASRELFLDFWEEPKTSERRTHTGIYHSVYLEDAPIKIQVILLDTRTFRDELLHNEKPIQKPFKNDYYPNEQPDSTFLGAEQWAWLEQQLLAPADLRIVASSNQFSHEYNGWESWRNVPKEQERFLKLIQKTKANGVVFISGDVHWGELSKYENPYTYPIYDLTSSGLTQSWHDTEPNKNRIGSVVRANNFGWITILVPINAKRTKETPEHVQVQFELYDKQGTPQVTHTIDLAELSF